MEDLESVSGRAMTFTIIRFKISSHKSYALKLLTPSKILLVWIISRMRWRMRIRSLTISIGCFHLIFFTSIHSFRQSHNNLISNIFSPRLTSHKSLLLKLVHTMGKNACITLLLLLIMSWVRRRYKIFFNIEDLRLRVKKAYEQ